MAPALSVETNSASAGNDAPGSLRSGRDLVVERALIRLALANARRSIVLQLAAMAVVSSLGWAAGAMLAAVVTFWLALLVALWRHALTRSADRKAEENISPVRIERSLTANAIVTGLMWMFANASILPELGRAESAVYLLLVCGSLVIAAGFLPFARLAFSILACMQLLGLMIALAGEGGWWAIGMAMLFILFGRSLLLAASTYRDTVEAAVRSGAEARQALADLEVSRAAERRASEAKTRLLATMSHEIRTPMNGVLGAIDLLRHSGLTPSQYSLAATAALSGESLLRVVNDVLDHVQLESGRLSLVERPTDIVALAAGVIRLFRPNAEAKGLRLELSSSHVDAATALVDPARLKQVLMNLVGNAIKFTEQGLVSVELRTERTDGDRMRLSLRVRDTGVGFDESVRRRLFEPFFQDRGAIKYGGSGLGLSICSRIVRQMGGRIEVDSRPGVGTVFEVVIMLAVAESDSAQDPPDSAFHSGDAQPFRGRVLLVDDNDVNRVIGTQILTSLGLQVYQAADGAQALSRLASSAYDLVLMDIEMPVLDGHAATRAQREREQRLALPRTTILALTANAFAEDVAAALAAGMDGHIPKPFTRAQLRDALADWLSGA